MAIDIWSTCKKKKIGHKGASIENDKVNELFFKIWNCDVAKYLEGCLLFCFNLFPRWHAVVLMYIDISTWKQIGYISSLIWHSLERIGKIAVNTAQKVYIWASSDSRTTQWTSNHPEAQLKFKSLTILKMQCIWQERQIAAKQCELPIAGAMLFKSSWYFPFIANTSMWTHFCYGVSVMGVMHVAIGELARIIVFFAPQSNKKFWYGVQRGWITSIRREGITVLIHARFPFYIPVVPKVPLICVIMW